MDHAEMKRQGHKDHDAKKVHHTDGGAPPSMRTEAMIREAIDEHDDQQHGGKKTRLKLKTGGRVEGEEKRERLDRAKGGRTKHAGHKTNINIVMPPGQDRPVPVPVPAGGPGGPGGPPPGMMPHPPMAGPPPGPGGPPMGPPVGAGVPMPHKRGGRIKKAFGGGMGGAPGAMVGGGPGMADPGAMVGGPGMGGAAGMQHGPGPGDGGLPMIGGQPVATMAAPVVHPVMGGAPGSTVGAPGRPVLGGAPGVAPGGGPVAVHPVAPARPMVGGAAGMLHGPGPGDGALPLRGGPPVGAVGYKKGGKVTEDAGAGSGLGRLEKTKEYGLKGSGDRENESFTGDGENKQMKRGGRS